MQRRKLCYIEPKKTYDLSPVIRAFSVGGSITYYLAFIIIKLSKN